MFLLVILQVKTYLERNVSFRIWCDEPLNTDQRDTTHQEGDSNYIEMN
jgi:hypothetical protein